MSALSGFDATAPAPPSPALSAAAALGAGRVLGCAAWQLRRQPAMSALGRFDATAPAPPPPPPSAAAAASPAAVLDDGFALVRVARRQQSRARLRSPQVFGNRVFGKRALDGFTGSRRGMGRARAGPGNPDGPGPKAIRSRGAGGVQHTVHMPKTKHGYLP